MNKPVKEVITVESISYIRWRWPDGGTTVETLCNCFGNRFSCHSSMSCPWMKKRHGPYPWRASA